MPCPSGETWVFRHSCAAELSLRPSIYFDSRRLAPRATKQIVLSARMKGYGVVLGWSLSRPIAFNAGKPAAARRALRLAPAEPPPRAGTGARHARGPAHANVCRPDQSPARRALISVSDKTGLVAVRHRAGGARGRASCRPAAPPTTLREAGLTVTDVAEVTGFPEMMDGRVKTACTRRCNGGLLALRDNPEHVAAMEAHGIGAIDLLAVNLYPFEDTVAGGADYATAIENIDIGGPAMIRAAAKNHAHVAVVVDPEDYGTLIAALDAHDGATPYELRQALALTAYARTAAYDAAVSTWLAKATGEATPRRRAFAGTLATPLRYGENPHQSAAFYLDGSARPGIATATQHQGKELSYNNINDTDAAFELVAEFHPDDGPVCAIIKHANPCGVARGDTLAEAYGKAFDCDRTSAFGGIVALNQTLDADTAERIVEIFTEVVIAPDATEGAKAVFAKKKNLRLLTTGGIPSPTAPALTYRQVSGGMLVQDKDVGRIEEETLRAVTRRHPSAREMADMIFAWTVAKHVKSNAIVYAKGLAPPSASARAR